MHHIQYFSLRAFFFNTKVFLRMHGFLENAKRTHTKIMESLMLYFYLVLFISIDRGPL
jgi:hypothetical protein